MTRQTSLDAASRGTTNRIIVRQSTPPLRFGLRPLAVLAAAVALALALVVGGGADRAQLPPAPAATAVAPVNPYWSYQEDVILNGNPATVAFPAPVNPYWTYTEDAVLDTAPCAANPAACGR